MQMPVSGLVLTLSREDSCRREALSALCEHALIAIGELAAHRLPIVVDTPNSEEDRAIWEWLQELPGVLFVDLVCTDATEDIENDGDPSNRCSGKSSSPAFLLSSRPSSDAAGVQLGE